MSNARVNKFERTVTFEFGETMTHMLPFTEIQAMEGHSVLEPDGIPVRVAKELCEKWTRMGQAGDFPKYSYRIIFGGK